MPWQTTVGFLNRRDLLRVASLSVAGSLLPEGYAATANGRARSVIVLWMAGGVTHIDSFDPKPDAPAEVRGSHQAIATNLPGVRFCETLPCLAKQSHQLALIRTFTSGNDDHFLSQAFALSGRRVTPVQITTEPNVGSIVAKLLGPRGGLPGYVAVPGTTRPGPPPTNEFTGGWLGHEYDPFTTGGKPRNEDFTARRRGRRGKFPSTISAMRAGPGRPTAVRSADAARPSRNRPAKHRNQLV